MLYRIPFSHFPRMGALVQFNSYTKLLKIKYNKPNMKLFSVCSVYTNNGLFAQFLWVFQDSFLNPNKEKYHYFSLSCRLNQTGPVPAWVDRPFPIRTFFRGLLHCIHSWNYWAGKPPESNMSLFL